MKGYRRHSRYQRTRKLKNGDRRITTYSSTTYFIMTAGGIIIVTMVANLAAMYVLSLLHNGWCAFLLLVPVLCMVVAHFGNVKTWA